jgi:hypothetical protein
MLTYAEWAVLTTLDPKKKVAVKLISKENLSRDSRRLRFALPSPTYADVC